MHADTIVALATPPGSGGIAIIRLSGPLARQIALAIHSRGEKAVARPRELVLGQARVGDRHLGDALVVYMPGPHSYTGEDVTELHLHGGPALVQAVLEAATQSGARLAAPGEFTKRAFLLGKLDLAQAEAVADIIAADSSEAATLASSQLAGALSERVRRIRDLLVHAAAALAANLDFGDEDVSDVDEHVLSTELAAALSELASWLADAPRGAIIREGFRVALVGLPNAGKSSLLNSLVGYDRAIVTNIAGTTRDTLEETISLDGLAVRLTDTAGIRHTENQVEKLGVALAHRTASQAQLILLLCPADQDPAALVADLPKRTPIIGIQTQIDRLPDQLAWPASISASIATSVTTGQGLEELRGAIRQAALGTTATTVPPVLANLRHAGAVKLASDHLHSAMEALAGHGPHDIIAGEITLAADALGQITGESIHADVIDAIFRNFCIGK